MANADFAILSGFLQTVDADAASELGGVIAMPAPSQGVVDTMRRLAVSLRAESAASPLVCAFAKEMQGKERQLLALLQQQHVSSHPSASADVFTLLGVLLACPRSGIAKLLSGDDVCGAIDASVHCDTFETAHAAVREEATTPPHPLFAQLCTCRCRHCSCVLSYRCWGGAAGLLQAQFVVAVARKPALQQTLLTDRALGCIFALHDRSGAHTNRAPVQSSGRGGLPPCRSHPAVCLAALNSAEHGLSHIGRVMRCV
jgi:hypothetical protein